MPSAEMIGGVKRSDKPKRGSRPPSVKASTPLVPYNVFAASAQDSAPAPPLAPSRAPAPAPAPAPRLPVRDDSESEGDETMARDLPDLDEIVKKMGKAATLKKTKVERVLEQLGAEETEALAVTRKKRERKAPEVYKPTAVVRKETKVRGQPRTATAAAVTPKKEPRTVAAAAPRADLGATDDIPKCFKELIQTHETYDPKLKNYRYELHKGNASVIPLASAYQSNKIEAAQMILEQELKNMESLKKLIVEARERAAKYPSVMDMARRAAELRARGPAKSEEVLSGRAPSPEKMSEGGAGRRKSSKKNAGACY